MNNQGSSRSSRHGRSGGAPSSDYIQRVADLYRTIWDGQLSLLRNVSRLAPPGFASTQEISEIYGRAEDTWSPWFTRFREFFVPASAPPAAPILVFVIDAEAEVSVIQTHRCASRRSGFQLTVSGIFSVGGGTSKVLSQAHVMARMEGNELRVGLVDLGHGRAARARRGIEAGRYSAVVFDQSEPVEPLALLDITFRS